MPDTVIQTEGLSQRFGSQWALQEVSVSIPPGAIGLLGPNGAGKSTFRKCLLHLLKPTSGKAWLLGRDIARAGRDIRTRVGYAPEQDCHIPGMVGCEYVTYCAQLSGMPFQDARQRAHEMLDFVGMGQERYRKVDTYSTGMKQRVKLAQAIVHDPEIVFLDEPTNGLDPSGREQILELIRSLWKDHGISVVLSSHLLSDVERICDQITIIALGKVLMQDRIDRLKAQRKPTAEIITESPAETVMACMQRSGWQTTLLTNGHVQVEHGCDHLGPLVEALDQAGITPLEILQSPNQLEALFVQALETHDEPAS